MRWIPPWGRGPSPLRHSDSNFSKDDAHSSSWTRRRDSFFTISSLSPYSVSPWYASSTPPGLSRRSHGRHTYTLSLSALFSAALAAVAAFPASYRVTWRSSSAYIAIDRSFSIRVSGSLTARVYPSTIPNSSSTSSPVAMPGLPFYGIILRITPTTNCLFVVSPCFQSDRVEPTTALDSLSPRPRKSSGPVISARVSAPCAQPVLHLWHHRDRLLFDTQGVFEHDKRPIVATFQYLHLLPAHCFTFQVVGER